MRLAVFATSTVVALSAGGGHVYSESGIDAPGAPDVARVVVTPSAGTVTFRIETASAAGWDNAAAILAIDTNGDGTTDSDYTLHSLHDKLTHETADGLVPTNAAWNLTGAVLTIGVPTAELGATQFGFKVSTPAPAGEDVAPNSGLWHVALDATTVSVAARFSPATPVHGRVFKLAGVTTTLSDGSHGDGAAACRATLGGRATAGGCRWSIPKTARGQKLVVTVTAAGANRVYRFVVR